MAQLQDVKDALAKAAASAVTEKAEVAASIKVHTDQIADLKEQVARGQEITPSDLDDLITSINGIGQAVQDITVPAHAAMQAMAEVVETPAATLMTASALTPGVAVVGAGGIPLTVAQIAAAEQDRLAAEANARGTGGTGDPDPAADVGLVPLSESAAREAVRTSGPGEPSKAAEVGLGPSTPADEGVGLTSKPIQPR